MSSSLVQQIQQARRLWMLYGTWLLACFLILEPIAGYFEIPTLARRILLVALVLVVGIVVLIISRRPNYRTQFTQRDRWITLALTIIATVVCSIYTAQAWGTLPTTCAHVVNVVSAANNIPIQGAQVRVELVGSPPVYSQTSSDGSACLTIPSVALNQNARVIVEANGYIRQEINSSFPAQGVTIPVQLPVAQ